MPGAIGNPGFVERLTMGDAVGRALAFNPAIKASFLEIEARRGDAAQASYKPNPELLLEVENFAGSKDKTGAEAAEETLGITQMIEFGDKRLKRLQAAHLDTTLAGWDFEMTRLQVATQAADAYVDVVAIQERVKVLKEFVAIADKTKASVKARVDAGKASPIEIDRAVVASARAKALLRGEEVRLQAAMRKLSVLWGAEAVDFSSASGRLRKGHAVPSMAVLKGFLDQNPTLARWSDEIGRRVAQLSLERAKSIPDVRVGAGVRQFNDNDSTALVASVSMPLQIFDSNQGNIAAAERRIAKAENDEQAARTTILSAFVEALGELEVAAAQVSSFERDVLPAASSAFDKTTLGYDEGKFDILNVLDVQRSVFDARLELLNARADYEKARVRLEALIGRDITDL